MTDLDIVIAHRGDELGLWATISSCEIDLARSDTPFDYKYHIVSNGNGHTNTTLQHLVNTMGRLGSFTSVPEAVAPPSARNTACRNGNGEFIFFFDNHCIVEPGYFERAVGDMRLHNMDALHSVTKYWAGAPARYHYRFTLERNFWGVQVAEPKDALHPYRIAAGGHGGFVVRRSAWDEVGGYWDGFKGYGGEEAYFELKLAMLDKSNWLDPKLIHWHYAGNRPYARDNSEEYIFNSVAAAAIIGGVDWGKRVTNGLSVIESRRPVETRRDIFGISARALYVTFQHSFDFRERAHRTLNQQLVKFERDGIAIN